MDTIVIVLVFISWLGAYHVIEKAWDKHHKVLLVLTLSIFILSTYLIGYSLTKII